jgi:amino acid adenylation domain-containing protein
MNPIENRRNSEPVVVSQPSRLIPVTKGQEGLWLVNELDRSAGIAYHIACGFKLSGSLDTKALQGALERIVQRHEVLRTRFMHTEAGLLQVIEAASKGFALEQLDWRKQPQDWQQENLEKAIEEETTKAFDLCAGPLVRGQLLRLQEQTHILLITQHHIVSDKWSTAVFFKELSTLYEAYSQDLPDPLPALNIQYADYATWQQEWLQGPTFKQQISFWKNHLQDAPVLLDLPSDHPRPAVQSYRGDRLAIGLSAQLTTDLHKLSQRHGVTLFTTLLAAWGTLLFRMSGQTDVVIGAAVANRQHAELEPLIGYFVNTLALRLQLQGDWTVAQLLAHTKATTLQAYANQEVPFEQVVEALQPPRSLSHSPVFQTMLSMDNTPGRALLELRQLQVKPIEIRHASAHFDLMLALTETGGTITGGLEFSLDLFSHASIKRLIEHFETLLGAMVGDDQQRIEKLELLTPRQRKQVLVEFNHTAAQYPQESLVHELFEQQVKRTPQATALVYEGRSMSYGELNTRANQLAHHLIGLGIKPDDRVAICLGRGLAMMVGMLGILKSGGAYVPLDPQYPAERIAYMLEDAGALVVVTQEELRAGLGSARQILCLDAQGELQNQAVAEQTNPKPARLGLLSTHLAYIIYTSGSTGKPKGVMIQHRSLTNFLTALFDTFELSAHDCLLGITTISFDIAVLELYLPLLKGAKVLIANSMDIVNFGTANQLIRKYDVSILQATPSTWRAILAAGLQPHPTLKALCGGEKLHGDLAVQMQKLVGQVWNLYGPTETTVWSSLLKLGQHVATNSVVSIGRPIANTQIYILDAHLEPLPIGVIGEIYIAGDGVARGYLNRPDLTAERFVVNPFGASTKMYRTGDLGRWLPDGSLAIAGRNDSQVKIRGFRIELGEIESAILAYPGIAEAATFFRDDSAGGHLAVLWVSRGDTQALAQADLKANLSKVLPPYMIPSEWIRVERLPKTPNGKLDRAALPAVTPAATRSDFSQPKGDLEQKIAAVWREILQQEVIGRDDDFFALGGHSILAVTTVHAMREVDIFCDLRDLFQNPTLSSLAAHVNARNEQDN